MLKFIWLTLIVVLSLVGCLPATAPQAVRGESQPVQAGSPTSISPVPIPTNVPAAQIEPDTEHVLPVTATAVLGETEEMSPGPEPFIARAKEQLTQLPGKGITLESISLVSVEHREWSDSSWGCPQPGATYTQDSIFGYLIILEVGGSRYEFHTNTWDNLKLCFINGQEADQLLQTGSISRPANDPGDIGERAVLVLERSGGMAGMALRWLVFPDGLLLVKGIGENGAVNTKYRVDSEQVKQLLTEIEAQGFFQLDEIYLPPNFCCDSVIYRITVHRGDQTHSVTFIEAAPDAPEFLWQIVEDVGSMMVEKVIALPELEKR